MGMRFNIHKNVTCPYCEGVEIEARIPMRYLQYPHIVNKTCPECEQTYAIQIVSQTYNIEPLKIEGFEEVD